MVSVSCSCAVSSFRSVEYGAPSFCAGSHVRLTTGALQSGQGYFLNLKNKRPPRFAVSAVVDDKSVVTPKEKKDESVVDDQKMVKVCDKLIEVFMVDKPSPSDWRRLLAFSKEWDSIRPHFYKRCRDRADSEDDNPEMKHKVLRLARKLKEVDEDIQRHNELLNVIKTTSPADIGQLVSRRRKDFTNEFFDHLHIVAESYYDNPDEQTALASLGKLCIAAVQAYDTSTESIDALNAAEMKLQDIINSPSLDAACRKIDSLAEKNQLDSALVLMITKAWSAAKDSNMMKDEVKDILYHLYVTARGNLQRLMPKEVRILKYLLSIEDPEEQMSALQDAFTPGEELEAESSSIPTLRDVSFEVSQGMNVAVCGTVGSGKSSLLSSILGEVPKISGTVKVCGRKAYVAQSPWIQSGKVEDNILFGQPMEREWYERVLEACSLNKDLELLPFHDQTVIGERGINISGGQKQRIQIARALYQNADIYLFDDPFSAVDAHTGSHLFNEVILGILKDKTVIYVTHQVEFLPEADLILVMKDGKITQAGRYNEILDSGTDFMELVGAHTDALATVDTYEQGCASSESTTNKEKEAPSDEEKLEKDSGKPRGGQLVQQEEREKGKVGFTVYKKYMALAYGGAVIPIILLVQILFQILNIGSNYWMTWVTPVSKDVEPPVSGFTLILVYVLLAIASSLCILFRALLVSMTGFKMATELFTQMHLRVFRGSMSFFDVTPMGRILNRASTDQSVVDLRLPGQFAYVAIAAINILGIMGVMIQVAWQVLIIFIPVVAASAWYRQYYISAARELARLAGISRSPLVHHFSETLSGVTTIRSFDQEPRFLGDIMKLNDCLSRLRFHSTGAMEWLCFRLELLSTIAFALSLVIVVSAPEGTVNPSFAGLAITYALNLNSLQSTLVWTLCDLENKMISVERMLQYIDIPSEPSLVIESTRPEKSWPSRGEITISNLQVRYGPHLPMVLHGLTCTFPGGLKTGIVGRTGCGKSTLIQTLFRIVEPTAGDIRIDGIDILTIGLHDLRSRLSIIPQDPTMFEGTVRSNLDPLEEYSDDQIWEALDKCQLGVEVRKKELKLDSPVSENGQNWSVGQRQLVCLGRVLLKRSKVLVLDEATASVDTATDNLIQETLRQHFADCTVITIAHRISSVIDSDMVLLLDQGLIKEHDSPARLLEDKSSSFSKLVAEYTTSSESKFSRSC